MAAGQQKRQSDGACSVSGNGIREIYAEKRKTNLELSRWYQRMRSHIALEWDEAQKKPVARKGQVAITWRHISPFYKPSKHHSRVDLADVFIIPEELYELKDLKHILSYEVWNTCLSDSERKLLSEFLPEGVDAESVLQSLFLGQNLHFGNPLVTWESSLCSGGMHPDAVCSREIDFKSRKKVYYSVLRNYHNDMLETLQRWKEIWESCKNPETELLQKIWEGSQKHSIANVQETSVGGIKVVIESKKQEHVSLDTIQSEQDSEFIKISQKQHTSILKMKQTGEELQLESVDATFGDTKSIDIQPFASLEELNKKKLAEYWMLLIERDLPIVHAKFVEGCFQRHNLRKKIEKEILERQEHFLYKASCEKVNESICNNNEMAQYNKESSPPVTNLSGYTTAKADLLGKPDLQIAQPFSGSNIQHSSSSKSNNSSDTEELFAEHALAIDSLPVEKSNMAWSPSLNMTSEISVSQIIKSEKHGTSMLKLEIPHPDHFSPDSRMRGNSRFTYEQPVSKDDAVPSVKETWSSAHYDSQELHSRDVAGSTVKERDKFLRKRPSSCTPPKPVEETFHNDSIRGGVMRSEPEKKARFGLENAGTLQDAVPQQIHISPGSDQLAKNQSHSFCVSTDEKGDKESHVLHLSSENPQGELELHPFKEIEVCPDTQILSLGMDDRFTQGSDLSLGQPQQPDKDDRPFNLGSQRFEHQQMSDALRPPFLDQLTREVMIQNMQSDEAHSLFVSSPHVIQARGRKHSIHHEISQTGRDHFLPSELIKGQTLQGFQHPSCLTQELQFRTDNESTEQQSQLQQRGIIQSGKQEGFNGHLQEPWIFNQDQHHTNQSSLFQHSQQNQPLQHSGQQDIFPLGLSPGVVPSWPGPLQVAHCRPLPGTAIAQFFPQPGNLNDTDSHFHASLCPEFMQRTSIPGQIPAGNNDERKLFGPLAQSDRLPPSTYGILNHSQYGTMNTNPNSGSSSSNNCHGQEDWVRYQQSQSIPSYSYHPQDAGSAYRAGHISWINIPPTLYANSQIAHFRQQSSGMPDFKGRGHI